MANYLLFQATNPDEVNSCAWALLKYLELSNLKPSAHDKLVVFTDTPAALESFGPFFSSYQFRRTEGKSPMQLMRAFGQEIKGNLLLIGNGVFPNTHLDGIFAGINQGTVYSLIGKEEKEVVLVKGFNSSIYDADQVKTGKPPEGFEKHSDIKDFPLLLRRFFKKYGEESIPNLVKLSSAIDLQKIREQKSQYEQLPFLRRLTKKVMGKGWNIADFVK